MCRNWKLWIGLGAVAPILAVAAPNLRPALPYLIVAACPLSMLAMAAGMALAARSTQPHSNVSDETNDGELALLRAEIAGLRKQAQR